MDLYPPSTSNAHEDTQDNAQDNAKDGTPDFDLVGGPFAVIESDPGVFTNLTRKFGVKNIELVEIYDIEPWAVDHLNPHGLIFCFLWRKDSHRPADFEDPAAERVWFANQLSDDACASHAILNVLLNCPHIDIGDELRMFKNDTETMSPVMRGLAITNCPLLRRAHNSLARPADIRGAVNSITIKTLNCASKAAKAKAGTERGMKPPPAKRARTSGSASGKDKGKEKPKVLDDEESQDEAYHFVGYVPAYGKVWELDGLKSGPLEVGELPSPQFSSSASQTGPCMRFGRWMDIARPALRMKMERYGGAAEGGDNIRFSLLAIVDGMYEKASDEFRLLKKERIVLERTMGEGWEEKVDQTLLQSSRQIFDCSSTGDGPPFADDFGEQRLRQDKRILEMSEQALVPAWETCIRNAMRARVAVEDELAKAVSANTDHIKRTHDYEPFLRAFMGKLSTEGLLKPLLGLDEDGKKIKARPQRAVEKAEL